MDKRMYEFSWSFIGDISLGRPNLGRTTRIEAYRLFQYTLHDILEQEFGTEESERLIYRAGKLAGEKFCEKFVGEQSDFNSFVSAAQHALGDLGIGILRVESANPEKGHFVLTVAEDLDCSGLPELGHTVCSYDEGFIAGLFLQFSGKEFDVKEVDCWSTGDRVCRFEVKSRA